jgi:hypothetical protein
MEVLLRPDRLADYELFMQIKRLPRYEIQGNLAIFPDEYADLLGIDGQERGGEKKYRPESFLFDYQRDITAMAIKKRKFAVFAECGLGKSNIILSYTRHAAECLEKRRCVLIVSPLMVVRQTMDEAERFWKGKLPLEQLRARDLQKWLKTGKGRIGIANYEAITEGIEPGRLGALVLDESSMLKSFTSTYAMRLIELGKGLEWKLAATGTPAPNDRIEYANHAVFLDQFPTINSFLSKYFVNRGETANRWEIKPHALRPFYRALSHWCIFLNNPATYGWKDNISTIPPINLVIENVPLTEEQKKHISSVSGDMFGNPGGITSRAKLSQLAKGRINGEAVETRKPAFIRDLVRSWDKEESTIIWCLYNHEQDGLEAVLPDAGSIRGETPEEERQQIIDAFKAGKIKTLISKGDVLGFGLNLQVATRQIFSGLVDSYETFHQCVKRSNRIGSTRPLNVHIPVTEIERAMIETVLRKAHRVEHDSTEQ